MFIVLLRYADNKHLAGQFRQEHVQWIKQGIDDGVFLMAGGLPPERGGSVFAHGLTLEALEARLEADPYIAEGVVQPEIIEFSPALAEPRLQFLLNPVTQH